MASGCFVAVLRKSCRPVSWQTNRLLVQLAGRKFLPGSEGPNFPKYLQPPRADFPFHVSSENVGVTNSMTAAECAKAVVADFQSTLHKYGAILYRGFPIKNWTDFSAFFSELGSFRSMPYIGGAAPRKQVGDKVYTASDEPPEICIELHNEMAYMHIWPKLILFYCDVPPAPGCGGESGIADVREILKKLDKSVVEKFQDLGIWYHYHWSDRKQGLYKSWQDVFFTEEHKDVEHYLKGIGAEFEWESDGSLSFGYKRQACIQYPVTGETLWFNHAHRKHASIWKYNHPLWRKFTDLPYNRFPTHSLYGDGSEIPEDVIQHIRDVMWTTAVGFQMQRSDVMILENHLVQHSRLNFTGERKLLVAILEEEEQEIK